MIKCEVVTTKINCEGKEVTVYGLDFYINSEVKPFKTVKDIFIELKMAEKLKDVINFCDVEEIHIDNIIDDYILEI